PPTRAGATGRVHRGSSTRARSIRRPVIDAASWRRIVSTSGSSGIPCGSSRHPSGSSHHPPPPRVKTHSGGGLAELRPRVSLEVGVLDLVRAEMRVDLGGRRIVKKKKLMNESEVADGGQEEIQERVSVRVQVYLDV